MFDQKFLRKVKNFEDSLTNLDFVARVSSPLSQKHLINGPTGLLAFPLIHIERPEALLNDSIRIFSNPLYRSFFGTDRKSVLIHLTHFNFKCQEKSKEFVDQINALAADFEIENIRLIGKIRAKNEFIELIKNDFVKFLIGSIILSFSLLLLIFKNFKSSLLPFFIGLFSMIWLFGLMSFLSIKINLLSSLLPPIIFFTSMSDAVHLMNAIYKSKKNNLRDRLKEAIHIVWIPTLLTSITTAIGFLSLLLINTEPIQTLGVFAACGILFAFIITFSFGLITTSFIPVKNDRKTIKIPPVYLEFLLNNRIKILVALIFLTAVLIPGLTRLKIDAYLLDDLPEKSNVRLDFEYSDKFLEGSKPYEMRIDTKGTNIIWDKEVMDEISKIEEYLINDYPIGRVQSPTTLMKYLNQTNNGGLNEYYTYPENSKDYKKAIALLRRLNPKAIKNLTSEDQTVCRIAGFFPEIGSYETEIRNERLLEFLNKNIDHSIIGYRLTGSTFLIDKSHKLLSMNLFKGLIIAVLIIGTILGIYFKSLKLMVISLIPNLLPLLIVAGVLGWLGISLKMTTAIIFTIAFGIAVDDTIHMMSYFIRNELKNGKDALDLTFFHAGSAILTTSVIMIAGFSLFLISEFGATFYLGLFVSISLLVALLIDLTILPILLLTFNKKNVKNR